MTHYNSKPHVYLGSGSIILHSKKLGTGGGREEGRLSGVKDNDGRNETVKNLLFWLLSFLMLSKEVSLIDVLRLPVEIWMWIISTTTFPVYQVGWHLQKLLQYTQKLVAANWDSGIWLPPPPFKLKLPKTWMGVEETQSILDPLKTRGSYTPHSGMRGQTVSVIPRELGVEKRRQDK